MNIIPFGDSALMVNFEQVIDPTINRRVIGLFHAVQNLKINGVEYLTPAYCSLAIGFDPDVIGFDELKKIILRLESSGLKDEKETRRLTMPVCYNDEFALDKEEIIKHTGLSWKDVVDIHTSVKLRVYMLGFLPGFVYMGSVPEKIALPRKNIPRLKVPKLSVGIAGFQTGVYPTDAPGGWQILGRTPIRIFDNRRRHPFLFEPGMTVRFQSIAIEEFENISKEIDKMTFQWDTLYE